MDANADKVLYVFYDLKTTQNKRYSDNAKANVPYLVCVQQFCARCEDMEEGIYLGDAAKEALFWDDPVGNLPNYRCEPHHLDQ